MEMLEIIIGMIFTFMVLSLLGTTVNELLSAWRGWRGHYLEEGLKRLLEFKDNPNHFQKFTENPFYQQLLAHDAILRKSRAPGYLTSKDFSSILTNILKQQIKEKQKANADGNLPMAASPTGGKTFEPTMQQIDDFLESLGEDSKLREVLEQLKDEGFENVDAYKARIENWFDGVMGQASGWYKRHMQMVTLFVGLGIAGVLNADSFKIYEHLSSNTAARESLAAMANDYVAKNETLAANIKTYPDSLTWGEIKTEFNQLTEQGDMGQVKNILGLGWEEGETKVGPRDWFIRILGWFITALAISLGASFWFDILKKIVTIRSSGDTAGPSQPQQVIINTVDANVKEK